MSSTWILIQEAHRYCTYLSSRVGRFCPFFEFHEKSWVCGSPTVGTIWGTVDARQIPVACNKSSKRNYVKCILHLGEAHTTWLFLIPKIDPPYCIRTAHTVNIYLSSIPVAGYFLKAHLLEQHLILGYESNGPGTECRLFLLPSTRVL